MNWREKEHKMECSGGYGEEASSAPNNIAALIIIFLVGFGIFKSCSLSEAEQIKEVWTIITPLITLAFGYLFGEKQKIQNRKGSQ